MTEATELLGLLNLINGVVWEAYPSTGHGTFISGSVETLFGYTSAAWIATPAFWESRLHLDDREQTLADYERLTQAGRPFELEYRMYAADGHVVWVRDHITPVIEGNTMVRVAGFMIDITAQKSMEDALLASEGRFRALVQQSSDIVTVVNRGGYITYASPSLHRILGLDPEAIKGIEVLQAMHPDEYAEIRQTFAAAVFGGSGATSSLTSRFRHADGSYRWLEWVATNRLDDPHVCGMVMNSRDVTDRREADLALAQSRQTFQVLFDHSPDGIMLADLDGDMPIVACNEVAASMNGYTVEELTGQSTYLITSGGQTLRNQPGMNDAFKQRIRSEGRVRMETMYRRKDGSEFPVELHLAFVWIQGREMLMSLGRDITERHAATEALRVTQSQLLASEKLAGLGRLTAGLAHEINTPLAATMNSLYEAERLAKEYHDSVGVPGVTEEDHREIATELRSILAEGVKSTGRIGEFLRTMRSHTRDTVTGVITFNAVKLVTDTLTMIAHQARNANVALLFEKPEDQVLVRGEPGRFTQVLTNLVVNGIHACESTAERRVSVRFVELGGHLTMEVEDTGTGIAPEVLPRIFDPLFTTKDVGKGTGLGLSILHDIVTGHFKGEIDVRTSVGKGTTFAVHFPLQA
ncbi:PAS domain S-box protein [Deinococcus arenicola]|uniref:histidine kinase n=1 Tax=Deinococcus arenicola TaxID=2994950 RepID=A0ABU4DR29_9DEIO|nr:PAS domain S-box protein [Deinococcus sp. ZS9-10]MDV6374888.1 PAS domain S-box protein [Deinococcus sp. ZS9-10]